VEGVPAGASSSRSKLIGADEIRDRITRLTKDKDIAPDPRHVERVKVLPSGFLCLDEILKIGGFAIGGVHDLAGEPDAGKSALCAAIVGYWQEIDPVPVDAVLAVEPHAGDPRFLNLCGANVDPDRLVILHPDSAEQAAETAMILMGYAVNAKDEWAIDPDVKPVRSITWDSWGGSPVRLRGMSNLARAGSAIWPSLAGAVKKTKTTLLVTNHIHEAPGKMFSDPRYETGGKKFIFMQASKLWITANSIVKDEETKLPIAHNMRISVQRHKYAPMGGVATLHFNRYNGFDKIFDAFEFFKMRGATLKESVNGTTLVFKYIPEGETETEEIRATGEKNFLEELRWNPYAQEAFITAARNLATQTD